MVVWQPLHTIRSVKRCGISNGSLNRAAGHGVVGDRALHRAVLHIPDVLPSDGLSFISSGLPGKTDAG